MARAELGDAYAKPETEMEQVIASVWEGVLKVEAVGRHDNLFEQGANAYQKIQARIKNQRASFKHLRRCAGSEGES